MCVCIALLGRGRGLMPASQISATKLKYLKKKKKCNLILKKIICYVKIFYLWNVKM